MTRCAITLLYALSLVLPFAGLMTAYYRTKKIRDEYAENDRKEAIIDARYEPRLTELAAAWNEIMTRPSAYQLKDERRAVEEERAILEAQRSAEYVASGVDVLTFARADELLAPVLRDRPEHRFHLARQEIIFVGTGILLGTAASIWSVWV